MSLENTDIHSTRDWSFSENMDNLRYLCLANNQIEPHDNRLTEFARNLKNLQVLDLSFQERSNVSFLTIDLAPTMTGLNMSRINTNKLELSMILVLLTNKNQLSEFVFSHNSLVRLQRIVINEPNPNASLEVDLSHNRISNLGSNLLTESISKGLRVTGLDISNNRLGLQFDERHERHLRKLSSLEKAEFIFQRYRRSYRINLRESHKFGRVGFER